LWIEARKPKPNESIHNADEGIVTLASFTCQ
jgi:hypothetical protein